MNTHELTIYRLIDIPPNLDGLFYDVLDTDMLDERGFVPSFPEFPGAEAVMVRGYFKIGPASWVTAASKLTNETYHYEAMTSGGLLLLAVDGEVYAIGFDQGYRLVPDHLKDHAFGLRFALRAVDPDEVTGVVRRSLAGWGRQDATSVPDGLPIGLVGIHRYTEIVKRLGGSLSPEVLGLSGRRALTIEGAAGLRLRVPLDPTALIELLRRINAICAQDIQPAFGFLDSIRPVGDRDLVTRLDEFLDQGLRGEIELQMSAAVPVELSADAHRARTFGIKVGSGRRLSPHLDMDDLRRRCQVQFCISPTAALRAGRVEMYSDIQGDDLIGGSKAIKWLGAVLSLGSRRFFLVEGDWYEGGAAYFDEIARQISALFPARPSIALPAWLPQEHERAYNLRVQHELGRASFLSLDREGIQTAFHSSNGFEPCDLYGPEGEMIHVKPADRSSPLSHQFMQALVSTEALHLRAEARTAFAELVASVSGGTRTVPPGTVPKKVIFAIMLKSGKTLSPATLFPFAQVALASTCEALRRYGVEIEVIPILQA